MAVQRTNPLDILLNEPWAFLIYGEPKVGKTTLAGSFPRSVVIACPPAEATSLAALPSASEIQVLGAKTWEDFVSAIEMAVRKPKNEDFDTIIVDNITPAYQMCVDYTVSKQSRPIISEATWTAANREMMAALDKLFLTNKDKNVIVVAHNRREKEGETVRIFPDFGESLARKITGRVNALFYYRQRGGKRELVTTATPGIDSGSRYEMPKSILDPTAQQILDLLEIYKQKVKNNNERV